MKTKPTSLAILALVPALAACGSSTPPVTVVAPPPASTAQTSAGPAPTPQPSSTPTTQTPTTPAQTRTGPGPAFTRTTGGTPARGDLQAAVAKLGGLGFTPLSTATYDPNQTLRLLVGARGAPGGRQAFFFDGAKYLGTDAATPSGRITVTGHSDTDATLSYGIYRPGDADCCPTGAPRSVRFTLDRGHLVAVDPIPSAAARR